MRDRLDTLCLNDNHRRNTPETLQSDNEAGGNNHDAHPLLVFGAVAIILVVLILRPGTAARSSTYAGDASMPMMCTDGNADASCDSSDIGDCGGGDASGDGGGGGSE